ncbi:antitoxin [Haloferula sp.]|uniref:antitoxin n=1 Tax=Haloferula sp. TaxID=2497595 RepID=UPI003C73D468
METTTVFKSGNSLAVRLPKGFSLPIGRVIITKDEAGIHLMPTTNNWPEDLEKMFPREPKLDSWERPEQGEGLDSRDW